MARHKVRTGIDYKPHPEAEEKRAEPGEVVDDLPEHAIPWLMASGHIEADVAHGTPPPPQVHGEIVPAPLPVAHDPRAQPEAARPEVQEQRRVNDARSRLHAEAERQRAEERARAELREADTKAQAEERHEKQGR